MLIVVVNGRKYLLAFKDFYVGVVTLINTCVEVFGNKRKKQKLA